MPEPAERAIFAPWPGFSSTLWTSVPVGMFSSGSALPTLDVGVGARLDRRADAQLRGREDVRLRAVGVVEQRDARRPVRVVLDRGDLRRHAVLEALEVDDAVAALVAAALVARRDPAVVVAAALLRDRLEQALLRLRLRDLLERRDGHEAAAGGSSACTGGSASSSCAPSKISILSPALSSTMAFFQPGRVPLISAAPLRLGLHLDDVRRATTLTSKSSSTAWRTCVLCASLCTLNV